MVYKLGNTDDLMKLPPVDENTHSNLLELLTVLEYHYGHDRNVDEDDGGFVLYAPKNTPLKEIKACFDYTQKRPEWVNRFDDILCALYVLNNEFAVAIVMSIADAPKEITDFFEEGY